MDGKVSVFSKGLANGSVWATQTGPAVVLYFLPLLFLPLPPLLPLPLFWERGHKGGQADLGGLGSECYWDA